MTPSYLVRLFLLSSASLFLLRLFLEALVSWLAPIAIRRAAAMGAAEAASMLFTLRLLPAAISLAVVATVCIPSYFRFEPRVVEEEAGVACLLAAMAGLLFCATAIYKSADALIRSAVYVRRFSRRECFIDGARVSVVPQSAGLALAGIVRPRLLISERVIATLSSDQLTVALRHEHAHRSSLDNLKRLLLLLAPAIFPRLRTLDRAWSKYAEWSADDRAASGDGERSLALAEALVLVARHQSGIGMPPLVVSLVESENDVAERVQRLLQPAPSTGRRIPFGAIATALSALLLSAIALSPGALLEVHHLLERLLD